MLTNIIACFTTHALFQDFRNKVDSIYFLKKIRRWLKPTPTPPEQVSLNPPSPLINFEEFLTESKNFTSISTKDFPSGVVGEILASQYNTITSEPMIPLCVSTNESDHVRQLGAAWCSQKKVWFWSFEKNCDIISKWLPLIYREDIDSPYILPILSPKNLWSISLCSFIKEDQWRLLANLTYEQYGYGCCICGCRDQTHPLEFDEIWHYIPDPNHKGKGIVKLAGLQVLCRGCFQVKNFARTIVEGKEHQAFERMSYINNWRQEEIETSIDLAFKTWSDLNEIDWTFDLSLLEIYGITYKNNTTRKISFNKRIQQRKNMLISIPSKSLMAH